MHGTNVKKKDELNSFALHNHGELVRFTVAVERVLLALNFPIEK